VEEKDRHVPMAVEIVGPDFDVLLLRRSGRQELLYVVRARTPAFGLIGIRMVIKVYGCKRGLE